MRFLDFVINYFIVLAFVVIILEWVGIPASGATVVIVLIVVTLSRAMASDTRTIFEIFNKYKKRDTEKDNLNKNPLDK